MQLVRVTVQSQDFVRMVDVMAQWLAAEGIIVGLSTYSGDKDHRNISFGFSSDAEGKRFAERFGGELRPNLFGPAMTGGEAIRSDHTLL
jgi:hypothetical protein